MDRVRHMHVQLVRLFHICTGCLRPARVSRLQREVGVGGDIRRVRDMLNTPRGRVSLNRADCIGMTPLFVAAVANRADMLGELLAAGADPNPQLGTGWTPLHDAADKGRVQIVRILLHAGASTTRRAFGETPSEVARGNGHHVLAALLAP